MNGIVIAIDGPAASGKSTTAKRIAEKLNLLYIDTGAMYRAATLAMLNENLQGNDEKKIVDCVRKSKIEQKIEAGLTKTYLNGKDVSLEIRSREVTLHIATIASNPEIREIMVLQQQFMGENANVVLDGRDIGTVVFPDADFKFFMVASVEERAKRRLKEFEKQETHISLEQVINEIKTRDLEDEMRSTGPLKKADDAILIDTSKISIDEQVDFIINYVKKHKSTREK